MNYLQGKVTLSTGATSDIGKSVAFLHPSQSVKVILPGENKAIGQRVARWVYGHGGLTASYKTDQPDSEQCCSLVAFRVDVFEETNITGKNADISGRLVSVYYGIDKFHSKADTT